MTGPVTIYLTSIGLAAKQFESRAALAAFLTASITDPISSSNNLPGAAPPTDPVVVRPRCIGQIDREDRSTLTNIATLVVNSVDDALLSLPTGMSTVDFENAPIFIGSDTAEPSFSALQA